MCTTSEEIIDIPYQCSAKFDVGIDNLKITFDNQSTGDGSTYLWDFGDGNSSTNTDPVYTYSASGTYTVKLTVKDPDGMVCSSTQQIVTLSNYSCAAKFSHSANKLKVTFTNLSTGDAKTYLWDFGDGNSSTSKSPIYTYSAWGTYTVKLSTKDPDGVVCSSTQEIVTLKDYSCTTKFSHTSNDLKVTFTNASTGDVDSRQWNLGDGTITTVEHPVHTYATTGKFTVCLANFDLNSDSCGIEYCEEISVDVASEVPTMSAVAIEVYPNPSTGLFHIVVGGGKEIGDLRVYNTVGAQIVDQKVIKNRFELDLSTFPKGVYQIVLSSEGRFATSVVVKE